MVKPNRPGTGVVPQAGAVGRGAGDDAPSLLGRVTMAILPAGAVVSMADRLAVRAGGDHVLSEEMEVRDVEGVTGQEDDGPLIEDELLIEEVSIDGMCGVY
jgi:mycofactocin precursor